MLVREVHLKQTGCRIRPSPSAGDCSSGLEMLTQGQPGQVGSGLDLVLATLSVMTRGNSSCLHLSHHHHHHYCLPHCHSLPLPLPAALNAALHLLSLTPCLSARLDPRWDPVHQLQLITLAARLLGERGHISWGCTGLDFGIGCGFSDPFEKKLHREAGTLSQACPHGGGHSARLSLRSRQGL